MASVRSDVDYISAFDLAAATAPSIAATASTPLGERG
jgi:hypothetical protein